MISDLRIALRQLARSPGFVLTAVLTLALGIGLSASSFSMANAFLLRNVPYPEAEQLVRIFGTSRQSQNRGHSPGNALELRDSATSFTGIVLYNGDVFALGEPGQVLGRDADAGVLHGQQARAAAHGPAHGDPAALRRVAHGVGEQVADCALDLAWHAP